MNFLEFRESTESCRSVFPETSTGSPKQFFIPSGTQLIRWTYRKDRRGRRVYGGRRLPRSDYDHAFRRCGVGPDQPDLHAGANTCSTWAGIAGAPEQLDRHGVPGRDVEPENQGATLPEDTNLLHRRRRGAPLHRPRLRQRRRRRHRNLQPSRRRLRVRTISCASSGPPVGRLDPGRSYYLMARVEFETTALTNSTRRTTPLSRRTGTWVIRRLPALEISNPDTARNRRDDQRRRRGDLPRSAGGRCGGLRLRRRPLIYYPDSPMRSASSRSRIPDWGDVPGSAVWPVESSCVEHRARNCRTR